jgi:tetratricopeptide (TPR) repeat protein
MFLSNLACRIVPHFNFMQIKHAASLLLCLALAANLSCRAQQSVFDRDFQEAFRAFQAGDLDTAEKMFKAAGDQALAAEGQESRHYIRCLEGLGNVAYGLHKYAEAEADLQRALALNEKTTGPQSPACCTTMIYLGDLYQAEGKYKEAEFVYGPALEKLEQNSPLFAETINNLGACYAQDAKYPEAIDCFKRAIAVSKAVNGPKSEQVSRSLSNLSVQYLTIGNYAAAEATVQEALSILSDGKIDTVAQVSCLDSIASIYLDEGKDCEAERLSKQALDKAEEILAPDDLWVGMALLQLAAVYKNQEQYEAAGDLLKRAIIICQKDKSREIQLADALNQLASLMIAQGKYDEARKACEQSQEIRERLLGTTHILIAKNLENLAYISMQQGDDVTAESQYRRALGLYKSTFGTNHPAYAKATYELGNLFQQEHKNDDAESFLKRALATREKALPPGHKDIALSLSALAGFYRNQGQPAQAEVLFKKLLERDLKYATADGDKVSDYQNLAKVLAAQGKTDEANAAAANATTFEKQLPGAQAAMQEGAVKQLVFNHLQSAVPLHQKWCLAIGISNFQDPSINLKYAAKDAIDFCTFLKTKGNFDPDHVKLLVDKDATRQNIYDELGDKWLGARAGAMDLVIIYVSSHGSHSMEEAEGANFLVAYDTKKTALLSTGIPMQWLLQIIKEQVHSQRILLVLDVCHSGSAAIVPSANKAKAGASPNAADAASKGLTRDVIAPKGSVSENSLPNIFTRDTSKNKGSVQESSLPNVFTRVNLVDSAKIPISEGQAVLCSSGADQVSWESKEYQNSVFTHRLIDGLQINGADTKLSDAFKFMHDRVEEEVLRDRGEVQTPVLRETWTQGDVCPLGATQ